MKGEERRRGLETWLRSISYNSPLSPPLSLFLPLVRHLLPSPSSRCIFVSVLGRFSSSRFLCVWRALPGRRRISRAIRPNVHLFSSEVPGGCGWVTWAFCLAQQCVERPMRPKHTAERVCVERRPHNPHTVIEANDVRTNSTDRERKNRYAGQSIVGELQLCKAELTRAPNYSWSHKSLHTEEVHCRSVSLCFCHRRPPSLGHAQACTALSYLINVRTFH